MRDENYREVDFGGNASLSRIWRLLRGRRWLALVQSVLSLGEGVLEAAILTLFARIALVTVNGQSNTLVIPIIGERGIKFAFLSLALLIVTRLALGLSVATSKGRLQFWMVRNIRLEVLHSYTRASWRSQAELDDGGLQQLLVNLPNQASSSLAGLLTHVGNLLIMVAMLSYALFADAVLTVALIASIVAASFFFLPLRRWIRSRSAEVLERQRLLSTSTVELSAMKFEVQACGIGHRIAEPIRILMAQESDLGLRLNVVKSTVVPIYTTITYLAVAAGLALLQGSSGDGLDQVGPILLVVLRSLSYGQGVQHAAIAISTLTPVLDFLRDHLASFAQRRVAWGSKPLTAIDRLELVDVSYSYEEGETVLQGASVTVMKGARVGIIGPSGSGKSTVVRLLLGLVQADSGRVLVNGLEIHDHDRDGWSQRIGVVPQSAQVLRGTLADNLRMCREGITEDDLWWALEVADLASDVRSLPDQLQTQIGAGARSLSGGQQQRLAIARAFATRPDLVVMDEPTSSIDIVSEAAVSAALERLPIGVTVIIVSHRMRILQNCDQLIVVEGGEITANGPSADVLMTSSYIANALDA